MGGGGAKVSSSSTGRVSRNAQWREREREGGDAPVRVNALGLALSRFMFAVLQEFLERNRLEFSGAVPLCDARRLRSKVALT